MSHVKTLTVVRRDGSEHTILFDDADAEIVRARSWHISAVGARAPDLFYAYTDERKADGRWSSLGMHVLLMGHRSGVDHINHNGLDNRRVNLRPVTRSQQSANRRPHRTSASPYKGVVANRDKWKAQIRFERRFRHLGVFDSQIEAAKAYDEAARDVWGEYAFLNFPLDVLEADDFALGGA